MVHTNHRSSEGMDTMLRIVILSAFLPGALASCFIDDNGFEQCNDGLSFAARLGIGIAGAVIFIVILAVLQYRRRKQLQKYYLSYLPPQGVPPPPLPQPQPQGYYASYTQYSNEPYGAYGGAQQTQPQSPQVIGVYSMYSIRAESVAPEPPNQPRYPPNVYDGVGAPAKA